MRKIKFVPKHFYHIYNRGVDKRNIFSEETDKWRFLQGLCLFNDEKKSSNILWQIEKNRGEINMKLLKDYIVKEERIPLVRILAYCLMPNHFHFLLEELKEGGITKFMHKFSNGYAHYFNKKYQRSGSLFEGPFKAVLIEDEIYLQYLLIYINVINPGQLIEPELKEVGIRDIEAVIKSADEYLWSTHQEYSGGRGSIIIDKGALGEIFTSPGKYKNFVRQILTDKKYQEISHLVID